MIKPREDIIRMAREVKLLGEVNGWDVWYPDELERFAQLVAAAEREACAKVCDRGAEVMVHKYRKEGAARCATIIRSRGAK